jgi:hypothetical protein
LPLTRKHSAHASWQDLLDGSVQNRLASALTLENLTTMRLGYVLLLTAATLLASCNATSAAVETSTKKAFTITSAEGKDTLEGMYVQKDGKKVLVQYDEASEDDTSSDGLDGQEERAGLSAGVTDKLARTVSGKKDSLWKKFMWYITRPLAQKEELSPMRGTHTYRLHPPKVLRGQSS